MAVTRPTDGFGIYEVISPDLGVAVYGPRLDRIAAAGFKVVINYALLYGTTANMIAYINYAASVGVKVAIAINSVCSPLSGSLAVQYPTMYTEAGSPGTTAFNTFGTYVINQVKALPGTWGYYIADEPQDPNHATLLSFFGAVQAADSTKPVLIICNSDTSTMDISNFWSVHTATWTDCCTVGGDDFYPLGLTSRSDDMGTVSAATQSYCNAHSVNSAIVLQAFNFNSYEPTLLDMYGNLNQCLAHMTPQLVLYYSYQNIWGGPGSIFDSPFDPDPTAATLWDSLARTIASVPSYYMQTVLTDNPTHLFRLDDPLCYTNAGDDMTANPVSISGTTLRQQTSLLAGDLDPSCHFNGSDASLTLDVTTYTTVYGKDTFVRANQSGLGTASDGQSWTRYSSSSTTENISSNAAVFSGAGCAGNFQLGSTSTSDIDIRMKVYQNGDGNNDLGPMWHGDGTDQNYYKCLIDNATLYLQKVVSGSKSTITSAATGISSASTKNLIIRILQVGTAIWCKAWDASGSEPTSWTIATTDSALSSGKFGLEVYVNASTNPSVKSFSAGLVSYPMGNQPFSVELWCSYDSFPGSGNYPGVLALGTSAAHQAVELGFDGDANRLTLTNKGVGEIQSTAAPLPDSVYHLVGTFDGSTATFYVNGVSQGTASWTFNLTYGVAYIGRISDGWNMEGYIKDVAIYNGVALSADRVLQHYNAGIQARALYRSPFKVMGNGHGGAGW